MNARPLIATAFAMLYALSIEALAQDQPNILILFPDDVGWQNVSAYGGERWVTGHPISTGLRVRV